MRDLAIERGMKAWMCLVFGFLFIPIFVVVAFSFNGGRNLYVWEKFSTVWYTVALENPTVIRALWVSAESALINAVAAVIFGTLAGLALARRKGRWTRPFATLMFFVLTAPELVVGIGSLIWFDQIGFTWGIGRIAVAHSLFDIAIVALVVRGRAEGLGESIEQAAADLGAPPLRAFLGVTLRMMLPAIVAGGLLAFTFSFDNVIISMFVQRPGATTLPVHILSSFKTGLRGDVAAVVVMALGITLAVILSAVWLLQAGSRRTGMDT